MTRLATACLALVLAAAPALAQQAVTVREINAISPANVDSLNALPQGASIADIQEILGRNPLIGEEVAFTAVVLTDWRYSGLASLNSEGIPGRIHVFVRDTSASSMGVEGMGIQIVDGTGSGLIQSFFPGDVIDVTGTVSPFGGNGYTMQIAPSAVTLADADFVEESDPLRQPVLVSTGDLNEDYGDYTRVNWDNFASLNGQYVRIENAIVADAIPTPANERPDWVFYSADGSEDALVNVYDTSLRYRNDRYDDYTTPVYTGYVRPQDDPFVPPSAGTINIQGFISFAGDDGTFDYAAPDGANLVINPIRDEDLETVGGVPPTITGTVEDGIPGNGPVTVTVEVAPGTPERTIASVVLDYQFSSGATGTVTLTEGAEGTYAGDIPTAPDGDFVSFVVTATDDQGNANSFEGSYRVLYDGVDDIADIQTTANNGVGSSPFANQTLTMNIEAVVQTDPVETAEGSSTFTQLAIQDDAGLAPWTGIIVLTDAQSVSLQAGDRITITEATVRENFGVTRLEDITFSLTGSGEPYADKVVPTGTLTDAAIAEAHEGMVVRFEDVSVTTADAGFGAFRIASDGTPANSVLVEDDAVAVPDDFNTQLEDGQSLASVRGIWYFSFSSYKVLLTVPEDVDFSVATEVGVPTGRTALLGAYPNPSRDVAKVRYETTGGAVRLAVYDVIGREVAVLVDGVQAAAQYEAEVRGLPAGVYLYRLTAGGETLTGKLTVVR